ncbi:MAG: selenide, water dikinase SelD [Chitinophagaceae bacterium]
MNDIKLTQFSKGGGCGCKISPSVLQQILHTEDTISFKHLLVGNDAADDAAVYQLNDETALITTTDFFLPIVDDAFQFGKIAAANAISDVYAMGGTPLMAIAILGWPIDKLPAELAKATLEGGREICTKANIPLAGGHTIDSTDPIFGLAVTGTVPIKNLKRNNTARDGDVLFLTKPLGTGILSTALKKGLLQPHHYELLLYQMTTLNSIGANLSTINDVHAMTDVTGFGLLGHAIEMAEGSNLSIELSYQKIHKIEGVEDYLKQRVVPDATYRNWNSYSNKVQFKKEMNVMEAFNLLPDPQTNGGLLIAVTPDAVDDVKKLFITFNLEPFTEAIGHVTEKKEKVVYVND